MDMYIVCVLSSAHLISGAKVADLPQHDVDENHEISCVEHSGGGGGREDIQSKFGE